MLFFFFQHESLPASTIESTGLRQRKEAASSEKPPAELMPLPKDPVKYKNARTVSISLEESLRIQKEAAERLKEAQVRSKGSREVLHLEYLNCNNWKFMLVRFLINKGCIARKGPITILYSLIRPSLVQQP